MPAQPAHLAPSHEASAGRQAAKAAPLQSASLPEVSLGQARFDPRRASPADFLALQRIIGNRSVQRLIQTKLMVGPAGDRYEQEADRVAAQVVQAPAIQKSASVQRAEDEEEVQLKPLAAAITPLVQRQPEEDEELQTKPDVQRAKAGSGFEVSGEFEQRLAASRGSGTPLPPDVRAFMEPRFGVNFSGVRLHDGREAAQLNRKVSALAFTHGQDIYLGEGKTDIQSEQGRQLLAHELTHVVQQTGQHLEPPTVQRKDVQHQLGQIVAVGVTASNSRDGAFHQVGHRMDVWVEIDAGEHPVNPPNAKPNTVYGIELEYWEFSTVPNDTHGPTGTKPWSDIYRYKPDALTFDRPAAGCDLTWTQAVQQAQAGTLKGRKKIGFADFPGLFDANSTRPKPNRTAKRTLDFRIVFRDDSQAHEIFATQVLELANGTMGYSAYRDDQGNALEAHGFGGLGYVPNSLTEQGALATQGNRVTAGNVPTFQTVVGTIPLAAQNAIGEFVRELNIGAPEEYVDVEQLAFLHRLPELQKAQGATDWNDLFANELRTDSPGIVAGEFMLPEIPGTERRQFRVPGVGILVAFAQDRRIVRMYFTTDVPKILNLRPTQVGSKLNNLPVRSFTEVPQELFRAEEEALRIQSTGPEQFRLGSMNSKAGAHLRGYTVRGGHYIVDPTRQIGERLKKNAEIYVSNPEIKDISGQWIKVKVGDLRGFLRASKVSYAPPGTPPPKTYSYHIYWTPALKQWAQIKAGLLAVGRTQRRQIEQQAKRDLKPANRVGYDQLKTAQGADPNFRFVDAYLRIDTAYTPSELLGKGLNNLVQKGGGLALTAGPELLSEIDVQSLDVEEREKKEKRQQTAYTASGLTGAMRTAFATKPTTVNYVKANHANYNAIAEIYDGIYGQSALIAVLKEHFEGRIRGLPNTATVTDKATLYETMRAEIPIEVVHNFAVDKAFETVVPAEVPQIKKQWWRQKPFGQQLVLLGQNNAAGILGLVAGNLAQVHQIEEAYDQVFEPARFGRLIHDYFVAQFKLNGNGLVYYQQLLGLYPPLDYLLKPAYRTVFGEVQLKTLLGQLRTAELTALVPAPTSPANLQAEQDFLTHGPYELRNFAPSTGMGKFDARLDPQTGQLTIKLKLAFEFKNFDEAQVKPGTTGQFAQTTWDGTAKAQYIHDIQHQVQLIWSGQHQLRCVRPGWNLVPVVQTNVVVEEVPHGQEHFRVHVQKGTLTDDGGPGKLTTGNNNSWVKPEHNLANLQEWDVKDKISDPAVHQFLHQTEKTGNIDTAYKLDRKRVENVLTRFGRIAYQANQANALQTAGQWQLLSQELSRLVEFSRFSDKQKLHVLGAVAAGESNALAAQRASHAQTQLAGTGYPIQTGTSPEDFAGVIITVPEDGTIKAQYDAQWRRISAAHEAGHMLGLVDEYNPVSSVELTRQMISDGLLPPDTPGDHLTGRGPGYATSHGDKQRGFAELLKQSGVSTPDFTQDPLAKSTSIMTGGFDVMTSHYVTIWEALVEMSERQANVSRKFWVIV